VEEEATAVVIAALYEVGDEEGSRRESVQKMGS